jgi:lipoprotein signal peptidase
VLFCIDRLLKNHALSGSVSSDNNVLIFKLFKNTGIAFSIPFPDVAYWSIALIAFSALAYFYYQNHKTNPILSAYIILTFLGGLSNTIDHILYDATIDYLNFFHTSAVNIADGMILAGLAGIYFNLKNDKLAENKAS